MPPLISLKKNTVSLRSKILLNVDNADIKDMHIEAIDINEIPVDTALFIIPSYYKLMSQEKYTESMMEKAKKIISE
ncbi:MAG: hypothetical protein QM791_07465 [Ferruginibacter sp.]